MTPQRVFYILFYKYFLIMVGKNQMKVSFCYYHIRFEDMFLYEKDYNIIRRGNRKPWKTE
jgi:hypothetical protein